MRQTDKEGMQQVFEGEVQLVIFTAESINMVMPPFPCSSKTLLW